MSTVIASPTGLKIFLVEDNEDTRNLLTLLLGAYGFEVCAAAGTVSATLREFPASGAHVLLSDLGLPDGDGWELLRDLRSTGQAPYAIAMSGFGTLGDLTASIEAGFRHHLVKPVDWPTLSRVLADAHAEILGPH